MRRVDHPDTRQRDDGGEGQRQPLLDDLGPFREEGRGLRVLLHEHAEEREGERGAERHQDPDDVHDQVEMEPAHRVASFPRGKRRESPPGRAICQPRRGRSSASRPRHTESPCG